MKKIFLTIILACTVTFGWAQATANQPVDLIQCDEVPSDGFAIFDLTQTESEILGAQNPVEYNITFHETPADAANGVSTIVSAANYTNIINPQQIYVRLERISNGDFDTTDFALVVAPAPVAVMPTPIEICDTDNDGFAQFDLTNKDVEIVGGDPDLVVSYHETLLDAQNGILALASPYQNITAFNQTVYARVVNVFTDCFSTVELELVVFDSPQPNQPNNIFVFEGDGDGMAIFDLTVNDAVVSAGITNPIVLYFETFNDAQFLTNSIANPTMYANTSNPQEIFVAVQDGDTDCYAVVSFIIVTDETGLPDGDNDTVPDAAEDINANGDLTDDDTDNDTIPNYLDSDDDGDNTPTALEDYNSNGSPTDDDTNANRTPDYLDDAVTLNVNENTLANLVVYPNPATDLLVIDLGFVANSIRVEVFDVAGKVVQRETKHNDSSVLLTTATMLEGVYFVRVTTEAGVSNKKIIKK